MSKRLAYIHPNFVPASRAGLGIADAGLFWGAVIVDRLRTFGGQLFRVEDHLRRFRESCRLAHVPLQDRDELIVDVSDRLVRTNRDRFELLLVWLATPGKSSGFATSPDGRIPTFMAYTQNLIPLASKRMYREGVRLRTCSSTVGVDPRVKHRSRLAWWIAAQEVHAMDRQAEPLFLTPDDGHVLETPTANVVAVIDGVLVSPPSGTVLAGVSLDVLRELGQSHGIPYTERPLSLADIEGASEILLTNTTHCLVGVSRVNDRPVGFPGPILIQLQAAWSRLVGVQIGRPAS